jgi:hypothetical protein
MTTLKLDFDGAVPRDLLDRMRFVLRVHRLPVDVWSLRRTRRGWHVTIEVRRRVAFSRVVLVQALLGSDWKRETFNSRRAIAWRHVPAFWRQRANVLYRRHERSV